MSLVLLRLTYFPELSTAAQSSLHVACSYTPTRLQL